MYKVCILVGGNKCTNVKLSLAQLILYDSTAVENRFLQASSKTNMAHTKSKVKVLTIKVNFCLKKLKLILAEFSFDLL